MARKEKPRYDGHCLHMKESPPKGVAPVVRFKNPQSGEVIVKDLIKGLVTFDNNELDDLIIARSDGSPTYNLTVVVDDIDMKITHVIRGDDHLNNTPRQINIIRALGALPPVYSHVAMILGEDGKRLSKRHGAVSVMHYREEGFLPEALLNYLVRLGWSHGDQEIFDIDEMIQLFDIKDINNSASTFNPDKLLWLNQHYIKTRPPEHVDHHLGWHLGKRDIDPVTGPELVKVIKAHCERAKTLVELADSIGYYYKDFEQFDEKAAAKQLMPAVREPLTLLREALADLQPWTPEAIHQLIIDTAAARELPLGKLAQPLRVAVTGGGVSPPIDITVYLVGRERVLQRLDQAVKFIQERNVAA